MRARLRRSAVWTAACLLLAQLPVEVPAAAATLTERRIEVGDGVVLRAFECGKGPALVFLHAFSLDHREWDSEVAAFAGRFHVVAYDLRAHGGSSPALVAFSHLDELTSLLDQFGIQRATLVGLSAGARIALDFAVAHPQRVTALVLASPGVSGWKPRRPMPWFAPIAEALRAGDAPRASRLWADSPLMHVGNPDGATRVRALVIDNAGLWRSRGDLERPLDPPALGRLESVRVPTLVLDGAADPSDAPDVAAELAHRLPAAQRITFAHAGHLVDFDAPEAFLAALRAFLDHPRPLPWDSTRE